MPPFDKTRHFNSLVTLRLGGSNRDITPSCERFGEHEDIRCPFTFVFVVAFLGVLRCCRYGSSCFLEKLNRLYIHADHWIQSSIGLRIGVEHFFCQATLKLTPRIISPNDKERRGFNSGTR